MSVSDLIATFVLALLLLQAAVRLPSALRGRSLSGAFVAFALAWWLCTDLGRTTIAPLGINDLPTLLKHILAC